MTFTQKEKYEEKSSYGVSYLNLTIYTKFLRKGWLLAILPGIVLALFGLMMVLIWPEYSKVFGDNPGLKDLLNSPVYVALLGGGTLKLDTFAGFWSIEIYTILEFLMLFLVVFLPVRIISNEVDKNTLDIALSYPVPRWQFLTQKYLVYITQMVFIPIFIIVSAIIGAEVLNESISSLGLILSGIGIVALFFSLGAISLLASALLLESGRALTGAAILVFGMWITDRIGALVESINFIQNLSLFHYISPRNILDAAEMPIIDFAIVLLIGVVAFVGALYIFQKRELAY